LENPVNLHFYAKIKDQENIVKFLKKNCAIFSAIFSPIVTKKIKNKQQQQKPHFAFDFSCLL